MYPDLFDVWNCGGKGGKPGPCPRGAGSAGSKSADYPRVLRPHTGDKDDDDRKFPSVVMHKGAMYVATGKKGKNIRTGVHVREYQDDTAGRLWLDAKGTIYPD